MQMYQELWEKIMTPPLIAAAVAASAGTFLINPVVGILVTAGVVGASLGVMNELEKNKQIEKKSTPIQQAIKSIQQAEQRVTQTLKEETKQVAVLQVETKNIQHSTPHIVQTSKKIKKSSQQLESQAIKTQELVKEIERLKIQSEERNVQIKLLEASLTQKEQELAEAIKQIMKDQSIHENAVKEIAQSSMDLIQRALRTQQYFQQSISPLLQAKDLEILKLNKEIRGLRYTLRQVDRELNDAIAREEKARHHLIKPIPQKAHSNDDKPTHAEVLNKAGTFKIKAEHLISTAEVPISHCVVKK